MNLLKIRRLKKRKKPKFLRCNAKNLKRIEDNWRRPKGKQNKLRRHFKSRGSLPSPGYGSPKAVRGLHPSGKKEVMIRNITDLKNANSETEVARFSATVGKKKRIELMKLAEEKKIRVLNPVKKEVK